MFQLHSPPAANLVISLAFTSIVMSTTVAGGIKAPLVHWFGLPPMLAILMGEKRSAWIWAALSSASVVGFVALDKSGVELANHLYGGNFVGATLWLQRCVDVFCWLVILTATAYLFDRHKAEQTVRLAQINHDLRHEGSRPRRPPRGPPVP